MSDLRKAAEDLLEVVEAAIKAGDWKVDGACDLDLAIVRLRQALAHQEQEPFIYVREDNEKPFGGYEHCSEADAGAFPVYTAPPKREWVGLTDDEIEDAWIEASDEYDDTISINNLGRILEAKLKEKNT